MLLAWHTACLSLHTRTVFAGWHATSRKDVFPNMLYCWESQAYWTTELRRGSGSLLGISGDVLPSLGEAVGLLLINSSISIGMSTWGWGWGRVECPSGPRGWWRSKTEGLSVPTTALIFQRIRANLFCVKHEWRWPGRQQESQEGVVPRKPGKEQ